jgi:hypothetical protein
MTTCPWPRGQGSRKRRTMASIIASRGDGLEGGSDWAEAEPMKKLRANRVRRLERFTMAKTRAALPTLSKPEANPPGRALGSRSPACHAGDSNDLSNTVDLPNPLRRSRSLEANQKDNIKWMIFYHGCGAAVRRGSTSILYQSAPSCV